MAAINGKVYLVGAGPGDPKLITLKGIECLQRADVVIYDLLINVKLLEHCPAHAKKIYGGKMIGEQEQRQAEIDDLMIRHARAGKTVVRLKGGDPFIFGRGGEEALTLVEAGIDFEVVPGITSAIAAPAYAGIPLTHRNYSSSIAFVTGHSAALKADSVIRWEQLATGVDTLVILMGVGHLREIAKRLIQHGRSPETPISLIHWGTTPQQKTLEGTLTDITEKAKAVNFRNPAAIVVGDVNALREQLRWFDQKPLFGRRIIVTRARSQASVFAECLESYGAEIIQFPTIETEPIPDNAALDRAIAQLSTYNWVIFTSVNAVEYFYRYLRENGKDTRSLGDARICAVGQKTVAALDQIGIRADYVPSQYRGTILAAELEDVDGQKILLPRASIAADDLPNGLRDRGAIVDTIPIYETVKAGAEGREVLEADLHNGRIDMVTFTSSSTVTNFLEMFGLHPSAALLDQVHIAVIGPSTEATAKAHGLTVDIVAKQASVESLAEEIVEFYTRKEKKK
ncbi:uroporphyrinogen-III C-methyltransferase [Candidatus Poribacteria bacterium]|nr:MAG: uroporphyrinogen-III C-methyltransferase [Candidatus Poribacteria bacterium]